MSTVIINGIELQLDASERLNGIQAARRLGIEIPHYCWHPGLSVVASCRMCLVESGRKDPKTGELQMVPKLVPACQTPATDGTVFVTNSPKVEQARAMVEEDLLLRHPVDCPICDKAGECLLQDYHFQYGQTERRADIKPFTSRRRPMGDTVTLFVDRCVMCTRCVRFTHEVTGTHELMVVNRGSHEEIDVFPGYPLDNKMSGNVVDLCPVGALGDVDFLYEQRVWFMKKHAHVCGGCATGCSIWIDENQDRIYRLKPRENPQVNQWWMCDEGRYGFKHVHDPGRLTIPRARREGGELTAIDWSQAISQLQQVGQKVTRWGVALSPHLTVEEAYLLIRWVRNMDPDALLGVGLVPQAGSDEEFPSGFTIRAEKCPNRRGIEQLIAHHQEVVLHWDTFVTQAAQSGVDGLWISGGYKTDWVDQETVRALSAIGLVIVQDAFESPWSEVATYMLPGAVFAERAGSFVNANDRLQAFDWAIRPPAGVLTEGQLLWRISGRKGLYDPQVLRTEIARDISYFSVAHGSVPEVGVDLRVNLLAGV